MKLALGYICKNEAEFLRVTLPKLAPYFDGIVAIDADSNDGTQDVLLGFKARVVNRPWDAHYGNARTACVKEAERIGYDWLLMLDADEAMNAHDLAAFRKAIDTLPPGIGAAFPRYEFVDDLFHFNPAFYPDYQCRAFPLRVGYHYRGNLHEQLWFGSDPRDAFYMGRVYLHPYIPIFHYGKCRDKQRLWLKFTNYDRMTKGEPLLAEIPPDVQPPQSYSHGPKLFFHGERPI